MPIAASAASSPYLDGASFHQSPVVAAPDELLQLHGSALDGEGTVVYELADDMLTIETRARVISARNTRERGVAEIVSSLDAPRTVVVRFPAVLERRAVYALRFRNRGGEWSNAVLVNDPRPHWFSPASVVARSTHDVPLTMRIVGRNLAPPAGVAYRVRLRGPVTREAAVLPGDAATDEFVLRARLFSPLPAGRYRVELGAAGRWLSVGSTELAVTTSDAGRRVLSLGDGSAVRCLPDDGRDDTACFMAVFERPDAARVDLVVGRGVWDLARAGGTKADATGGLIMPAGLSIRGAGSRASVIRRHPGWLDAPGSATFTLLGHNSVTDLGFDDRRMPDRALGVSPTLRLGQPYYVEASAQDRVVSDLQILRSRFTGAQIAVADGGRPLRRLVVADNLFRADEIGLWLGGHTRNLRDEFSVEDALIEGNRFEPGSFLDAASQQGTIASVIGASRRIAFVDNVADGAARDGLRSKSERGGWRAAFFWHLLGNQEQVLVAGNEATCTGDQVGDGEAIAFDNNTNTYALARAEEIIEVSRDSVVIGAKFATHQRGGDVGDGYYVGHWLQVVDGPGVGQARRITAVDRQADRVRVTVSPAFESLPSTGSSRVMIGRSLWQVLVVGNRVDHRHPPCRGADDHRPRGGGIGIWAQSADTVVAGNRQYAADGIITQQTYLLDDAALGTQASSFTQFSLEIRDNVIDGERDWRSNCSRSGIQAWHSAAPSKGQRPPVVSYGLTIQRNHILRADGLGANAIGIPLGWHAGPPDATPTLLRAAIVQDNVITDVSGSSASGQCDRRGLERAGIGFAELPTAVGITLRHNRCVDTPLGLRGGAASIKLLCDTATPDDCACGHRQAGRTR